MSEPAFDAARKREAQVGDRKVAPFGPRLQEDMLPKDQFLRQLNIEKRRTDRTKSPVSLVLFRLEGERGRAKRLSELASLLARSKRETDILGYLNRERLGLLLPHTDRAGAEAFLGIVGRKSGHIHFSTTSGTYPEELFDHLLSEPDEIPDALTYFLEESRPASPVQDVLKRAIDFAGSLGGLVVFSPVMLAVAIAVKASSPGPIIFRQQRVGKGGVPFTFYKFRSMRANNDDSQHREFVAKLIEGRNEEINQGGADKPMYKMVTDPRITRVGRFIRKTSLDELPQLFNVLKGDMSLVGPRPPLPYEAERYQSWHLRRVLEIRPGITGLWQVEGRSKTTFDEMVRLDLRYIRERSFWFDIKILFRTIGVLLPHDGAS